MSDCPSDGSTYPLWTMATSPGSSQQTAPFEDIAFQAVAPRLISPTWLEKKGIWPGPLNEEIRDFMVTKEFYSLRKVDSRSRDLFEELTIRVQSFFDMSDWDEDKHKKLLQKRLKRKIDRTRTTDKLGKPNAFASDSTSTSTSTTVPNKLANFQDACQSLEVADYGPAISILVGKLGADEVKRLVKDACDFIQPVDLAMEFT